MVTRQQPCSSRSTRVAPTFPSDLESTGSLSYSIASAGGVTALVLVVLIAVAIVGFPLRAVFASALSALVAAVFVATLVPNSVRHRVERLDRHSGIVAGDDQLRGDGGFLSRLVTNDETQARSWSQRCREGVVHQFPVRVLAL